MNAMKASIGQLKYRHIFKLMFSCCFLSELDAMFVLCCCNYRWKLSVHQKLGFSGDRILERSGPWQKGI